MPRIHYYTKDGLAERIREIRINRERLTDREAELVLLYDALDMRKTKNWVIDDNGKLINLGTVKKEKRVTLASLLPVTSHAQQVS